MIYTVEITDQADNDIRNIYEYIAYELQSPENASGQLDRIERCIMSLDDMPERYRFYDREPWKSRGLHIVPVDDYCVLYIVDNSTIPTFFIYGEKDPVAGFGKGIAKVYHAYHKNNENTKIYCMNDATHDILHDRMCSDIIFDKIEAFIHYVEKEKMPKN